MSRYDQQAISPTDSHPSVTDEDYAITDDNFVPYAPDDDDDGMGETRAVANIVIHQQSPQLTRQQQPSPQQPGFSDSQLALIKSTLAPGISDDQLALFAMVAERSGLDPFQRQIYAVLRNAQENGKWVKRMTIQTGIDGYLAIADRTGEFAGVDDIEFDTEDGEHPNWARATVWRWAKNGQRVAFTYTARWREYVQLGKDDKPTAMWKRMPWTMLGKCALGRATRQGFPAHLSGIYTTEEMMQADSTLLTGEIVESEPVRPAIAAPVAQPATPTPAPSRTAVPSPVPGPTQWNPLGDSPFRRRCNVVGVRSVAQVEQMLKDAGATTATDGVYHKDKALAYLVNLEAMHAEAAAKARKAVQA